MHLPALTIHRPSSIEEACELLRRLGPVARAMAGGTDLLVDLKTRRVDLGHLVLLAGLPGLAGLSRSGPDGSGDGSASGPLRIGALTTIAQLHASPWLAGAWSAIREAARDMAATQVRNMATVGGNLAGGVPCADLPPILLVLGASVEAQSRTRTRTIPLRGFFVGPRRTVLDEGEVLTAVIVPEPSPGTGAAYERFALREGNAIAVAAVAASARVSASGGIVEARLALGAVGPVPRLVEVPVEGTRADDLLAQAERLARDAAEPISDVRASADYRRELTGLLARRALGRALARAREARR